MANSPKKTIDPTEAALSAIQEALNIHDDEEPAAAAPEPASDRHPVEHKAPVVDQPTFHERFEADPVGTVQAPGAANDDRQSIGQILQALQRRPARTSYFIAAIFSAAWVIGCLALSWAYLPGLLAAAGPGHSTAGTMAVMPVADAMFARNRFVWLQMAAEAVVVVGNGPSGSM